MGPYCNFCNNRCFTYMPERTPAHILACYGTAEIIATCPAGQRFERAKVGYCYDDIQRLLAAESPVYFQVERNVSDRDTWIGTDFRISGCNATDALRHAQEIAAQKGWIVRLGQRVRPDDHYCDFAWVNAD